MTCQSRRKGEESLTQLRIEGGVTSPSLYTEIFDPSTSLRRRPHFDHSDFLDVPSLAVSHGPGRKRGRRLDGTLPSRSYVRRGWTFLSNLFSPSHLNPRVQTPYDNTTQNRESGFHWSLSKKRISTMSKRVYSYQFENL